MAEKKRIHLGETQCLMALSPTSASTSTQEFVLDADNMLASLYVTAVTGTLDVKIETYTGDGKTLDVITFPSITSPTANLLLEKAAATLSRNRIIATYTGACTFEVFVKGSESGEATSRILGQSEATGTQKDVLSTVTTIVPASLGDRAGIMLTNMSTTDRIYVNFTSGTTTVAEGTPVFPLGRWTGDLASGVALFGISDGGTVDVRIQQTGV